jgi:two-component system sensor histidine kinase KdpD
MKDAAITFSLNIAATALSLLSRYMGLSEVNVVVIYLLSVLITSRYTRGYAYGIAASVISMLSFNFFFTEPLYTLSVYNSSYIFTFIVMLFAAIFTCTLTSKLVSLKELANERENQAQILYNIISSLAKTGGVSDVAAVSAQCLSNLLECDVTCIVMQSNENQALKLKSEKVSRKIISDSITISEIEKTKDDFNILPIKVRGRVICLICLPRTLDVMNDAKQHLLDSVVMQIAISMERELLTAEKETAKAETEHERLKSNLLRAISHDLRTPLAGITGAAEMLLHNLKEDDNIKLVQGIYEDSGWLARLVENVLSLTRIQEGRLSLNIRPEVVEEIVAEAINRASKYAPDHRILISVPDKVLFIPMDGKLIEQVIINLVDNAIKHTSPTNEIIVSVWLDKEKVWFEVSDNGAGIDPADLPRIFDMFFVSDKSHTDARRGIGLGLAICRSIVNYHGGEIYVENNNSGGASFRFYLNA